MRQAHLLFPLLLLLLSPHAKGFAETPERPSRFQAETVALSLHSGFGTPYGLYGGELEYSFTSKLSFAAGLGRSFEANTQGATSIRLRLPLSTSFALGLSGGFGTGDWTSKILEEDAYKRYSNVLWGNGEVFVEGRSNALLFRAYAGMTTMLLGDCDGAPIYCAGRVALPVVGIAIGTHFGG